ncbi:MAG TPA: dihydrolipoamide acetyltransferase family protein, partial [Thermoanaerobaculia bacterium]|nr:dihydrolipoamide acetyltransferase family protein [Thermoanaerobaculia bacterium]
VPVNQVVASIGAAGEAAGAVAAAPEPPAAPAATATPDSGAAAPAPAAPATGKAPEAAAAAPAGSAPANEATPAAAGEETVDEGAAGAAPAAPAAASGAAAPAAIGPRRVPAPAGGADGAAAVAAGSAGADGELAEDTEDERLRRFSSPLVRSIAAKEGVDLQLVEGTGAHGRVTKGDILGFLEQRRTAPPPARPAAVPPPPAAPSLTTAPPPAPPQKPPAAGAPAPASRPTGGFHVPAYFEGENVEIEPMSKIRQITAAHMVYSKATSAHVTTIFDFDMSRVARARARAKEGFARKEGTKLTFMPFIFKAVVNALKAHRKVNAAIDGTNIVYKRDINLGMAVDLGHGLIVPVIKHADLLNLVGLAKAANDLAERARSKKLKPEEAQGGTFTITNPGVFGSLFGTPIINQPQVAILGVGAIEKRPVVVEDELGNDMLAIRTRCYFGITYDHRLVDGADADRFMNDLKKTLETDTWTELEPYA